MQVSKPIRGNEPPVSPGLHVYIGTTGTGKTHKAIRDAITLAGSLRQGVLVIDSGGAENLREIPEAMNPNVFGGRTIQSVFASGSIIRMVPKGEADFGEAIRRVDRYGNCVLFIDECAHWAYHADFLRLCRVWRHRKISLFLTTQKVGRDLEQTVLACDPTLYVFRCTASRTKEYFERWYGLKPDALKALKVGEHYTLRD